jgi:phospholipase C
VGIRRRRASSGLAAAVAASAVLLLSWSAPAASAMPRSEAVPHLGRVVVIVMENESYGGIIGNPGAPFLNGLASRYGLATYFFATRHPSLPNYIAMIGGDTYGIHNNCTDCSAGDAPNLVDQMEGAGISWKAYMSAMPSPCHMGVKAGKYVKRHNPFVYFNSIVQNPARCAKIVPLTQMATDLSSGDLPSFVWITPDLCEDMHNCPVSAGDQFLAERVPPLIDQLGPDGVMFITWDEGDKTDGGSCCKWAKGGHIVTLVIGPGVIPGVIVSTPIDHYSMLQTIEDGFGLPRLGKAGCRCTASMGEFFS